MHLKSKTLAAFFSGLTLLTAAVPTFAQDNNLRGIALELSAAEEVGAACRISFVATNGHETDIEKAVYEVVLFGESGAVERLTLLDFRDLPAGRPRVRQFQFDKVVCSAIPRILINGAETCDGVPKGGCTDNLSLRTRTKTELIG